MLLFLIACSGPATPPASAPTPLVEVAAPAALAAEPDAWIAAAVEQSLEAEIMPGTSGDPDPERAGQLAAFFEAHPEYSDKAKLDALLADACADGVEGTHERMAHPTPKVPLLVEAGPDPWRLVVTHADVRCTSDDWGYFTHEVSEALDARHVPTAYANADNDVVVVKRGEEELARVPLTGQGYTLLAAGQEPSEVDHSPSGEVIAEIVKRFGLPESP